MPTDFPHPSTEIPHLEEGLCHSLLSCLFTFQKRGPLHFSSCPFQGRKFYYMASFTCIQLTNSSTTSPDIVTVFFSRSCIA